MKSKITLLLIANFIFISSYAQFAYKVSIENPTENGFYKIPIIPDIKSLLKSNFSDIRIYDSLETEVPYLLNTEKPVSYTELFSEYEILEKEHKKKFTRLIIRNKDKEEVENIILIIKNAEFTKHLEVNASDDQKEWFVLKEHYWFRSIPNLNNTSEIRVLNLALNNYEFFEIIIYDYFEKPINILSVGKYKIKSELGKYTQTAKANIEELKNFEAKKSVYKITFPSEQYVDKIELIINHETFYFRDCEFLTSRTIKEKAKEKLQFTTVSNFEISSGNINTVFFTDMKIKELYLKINNNDDKAVTVSDIKFYQLNTYMFADFKKDNKYILKFSDKNTQAPIYDLQHFADSIPEGLKELKTGKPEKLEIKESPKKNENEITGTQIIWLILAGVMLFTGYFSYKIINDMKKKKMTK